MVCAPYRQHNLLTALVLNKRDRITVRKLAIAAAVSISLAGLSDVTQALGLGEIEMYSALNQSLDAEIAILSATEDELKGMQVKLAPADAFARAGLQQLPVLSSVSFSVDRRPDGIPVVKVTSDGPVLEPFLNFLIEVDAPGSVRLVREYTVLLNPPAFASEPVVSEPDTQVASYEPTTAGSFSESNSDGVQIDLSDAVVDGGYQSTLAVLEGDGTDLTGEVFFSESAVVAGAPRAERVSAQVVSEPLVLDSDDLFVPDDQIFANAGSASTLVDSNGEVISLQQELNLTPQFDEPVIGFDGGESVELVDDSEALSLDNLGAVETIVADVGDGSPIFENEFADDDGAEVISGDALRALVEPMVVESDVPQVEFVESSVVAPIDQQLSEVFTTDDGSTVADSGLVYGDSIDLSGVMPDSQPVTEATEDSFVVQVDDSARDTGTTAAMEVSGNTYRIQPSDTLWRISNQEKARGVTPHQMMVALLNANPDAFVGGNMNRMRRGAVLEIPTVASQNSIDPANALAIVQSWTRGNRGINPSTVSINSTSNDTTSSSSTIGDAVVISSDTDAPSVEINRSLDEVNRRMEEARNELASETLERDELQGRVNDLENNMSEMKSLITVRESELNKLQNEVASVESEAATLDSQSSDLANAATAVGEIKETLTGDLAKAQEAIERRADADKNLATAEAQAQSIRLSSEEDALRAQLAALEIEKRELEASSQLERATLVRQSEAEKTQLLQQAEAERARVMSELESEKARITQEAELEVARIRGEADTDRQRLLAEAEAERDRVAKETAQMQSQLAEMEAEKTRLLAEAESESSRLQQLAADERARLLAEAEAERVRLQEAAEQQSRMTAEAEAEKAKLQAEADEQSRLIAAAESERQRVSAESARVKDRLAKLQEEGADKLAGTQAVVTDTDADGTELTETGKKLAAGGAAAVGGLLGFAPLQETVGNRKNVLGIGAGLSLLGLLGAWGFRRRNKPTVDERELRPRAMQPGFTTRTNFDDRQAMQDEDMMSQPQNRVAEPQGAGTAAAAAATAALAAAGTAAVVSRDTQADETVGDGPGEQASSSAGAEVAATNTNIESVAAKVETQSSDAELDEGALDDTITEAEVYLRYGLHGQAEDLLKTAIERSPNNEEYHYKLLENYYDQKNTGAFNEAAATFNEKFASSSHLGRVAEMGRDLEASAPVADKPDDSTGGGLGAIGMAAGAGAAGLASFKGTAESGIDSALKGIGGVDEKADLQSDSMLDQTIDPGSEFSVDELQATGNLSAMDLDPLEFDDQGNMSLDEVDLASLDDDGTMNLEAVAGNQMSGLDLGTLDLTNPDVDSTFDNLTLDDADINSLGNVTGDIRSGLESDISVEGDAGANLGSSDEMETMLDLAKAYLDMGDNASAEKALKDIVARGNPLQQIEAKDLLKKV